ncbi:hypothetical protein GR268_47475, partial [Rhizobium leguminosarum]|nr:hypothetical protein [Rhizobium leguminosarum]
ALTQQNIDALPAIHLPDELMLPIFSRLSVIDLIQVSQVCQHWHQLSEEPVLWRSIMFGNYPASESIGDVKLHMLRVYVNTLSDLEKIRYLVNKYQLNKNHPFACYHAFLGGLSGLILGQEIADEQAAQGNQEALKNK